MLSLNVGRASRPAKLTTAICRNLAEMDPADPPTFMNWPCTLHIPEGLATRHHNILHTFKYLGHFRMGGFRKNLRKLLVVIRRATKRLLKEEKRHAEKAKAFRLELSK